MVPNFNLDLLSKNAFLIKKEELKSQVKKSFGARKDECILILNSKEYPMTRGRILVNFILLQFYVRCGIEIVEDDLFLEKFFTGNSIKTYSNRCLERFSETNKNNFDNYRETMVLILDEISDYAAICGVLKGITFSLLDFIKLSLDEDARKFMRPEIPDGLQFHEVEQLFSKTGKEFNKYILTRPDLDLYDYISSNTGINQKQETQMCCFVGLKPDMKGGVIPVLNRDNFVYGLSNLENYFINCVGTRKALCTNYTYVRKSGYLTRKLSLALLDRVHDADFEDCGTKHCLKYNIDNQAKLNQIIGRHYYDILEDGSQGEELKTITGRESELIGKVIALRSPVCCAGHGKVCATCYGKALAEKNRHLNTGLNAVFLLTDPLTQRLLSAKHLLSTNTEKIEFGEEFNDAFIVNLDTISFDENTDSTISFEAPSVDDYDEDLDSYIITKLKITNNDTKKTIDYESPVDLLLSPEIRLKDNSGETITVNSKNYTGKYVFKYIAKNNELTKSLENILNLIESTGHLGITDYNEFVNKFDDLLIENGLGHIRSVHAEMITSVLIRDKETGEKLDFSQETLNDYDIIRISNSVMRGPLSKAIAFERVSDQLADINTYEKHEKSRYDVLFK